MGVSVVRIVRIHIDNTQLAVEQVVCRQSIPEFGMGRGKQAIYSSNENPTTAGYNYNRAGMDGMASARHQHDNLSRHPIKDLLTIGWSSPTQALHVGM